MLGYVINGLFLTQQTTGIQRYATEICRELDRICKKKEISIVIPEWYTSDEIDFKNLRVVRYGIHKGILWEQIDLGRYLRKYHLHCLNMCNSLPLGTRPGITVLHDIMFKIHPEYFSTFHNKLSRIWHTFLADYIVMHENVIVTPSHFSEHEIRQAYKKIKGRVDVIPNAWQHIKRSEENPSWQEKFPEAELGNYYFTLATRARNKNGKWIIGAAEHNPQSMFLVAGRYYDDDMDHIPSNVKMLGYVSDEDIVSLMKHCKAFLFPSFYEGFGIPPLEALALGTEVIVSDIPAMRELFGNAAHYIDPYDHSIELDGLLKQSVAAGDAVLRKYSWKKSAKYLYCLLSANEL